MRALISGATGFIGSVLVEHLRSRGLQVEAIARTIEADFEGARGSTKGYYSPQLRDAVRRCDIVSHLGALIYPRDAQEVLRDNVWTTHVIGDAAVAESEPIIYVSTSGVYGQPSDKARMP